ncbi:TRAP transporter large permease subunit [Lutimaribacter sp. EGI FJ00015]|uniref:TRAP transporter large permease subunit n=1 Tax=Lutimaribacter degradans TaxID=2945989 RepID=A0ACC5ZUB9_9RHOB|nr:TRAP transporter large permease subunit [Lutimaribacter sp. EGI FJ00013]MCM2561672.1 TRAP transporter large permease subunit [Lutimaribacter sp. EGI FJ00013]MCO0612615.1 TRAP transporter large permease subunit [Lutimaribacter sp. EGI FJ00015]MCO0635274.1 TRAP transporter large permease subunit [Lutimaribacter sp. EGI FJ00014]
MIVNELFLAGMVLCLFGGILSGIPAMLAISGVPLVAAFIGSMVGVFDLGFLKFFPARVYGTMSNPLLMAVPLFVLMGVLLERSRLAESMLEVLGRMLGGSTRGIALSVLVFSAIIAASTGIVGATVVMLVLISLPAMLDAHVPKRMATGIICASGTLGQIIPPSILLVLLGDQIGNTYLEAQQKAGNFAPDPVSVGDLFAGAMLPGLLLVSLYGIYIFFGLKPVAKSPGAARVITRVGLGEVLSSFAPPLLLILAVLGSILAGIATTTEAAGLGAIGALMLAAYRSGLPGFQRNLVLAGVLAAFALMALRLFSDARSESAAMGGLAIALAVLLLLGVAVAAWRLSIEKVLHGAVGDTLRISGMVFGIVVAATLLALVFRGFGGDEIVMEIMDGMPGGEWGALVAVMLVVFLLGFILEAVEIIYIVVPLLGPPLLAGDISPIWFGVLLAMNLQTSFLTPPFGFALFYFRSTAPRHITTTDIYAGVAPFVVLQLIGLGLLIAFPALATWLPGVVFGG